MNIYIYDSFLNNKKYFQTTNQIEAKITDLGLNGKICRLTPMRTIETVMREELIKEPTTVVAVGDDFLVNKLANFLVRAKIPLAIIPVGEKNSIAESFDIDLAESLNVLAARRVVNLDLGSINNDYVFVKKCELFDNQFNIKIDDYNLITEKNSSLSVINFSSKDETFCKDILKPEDGLLELCINKEKKGFFKKERDMSLIKFKNIDIVFEESDLFVDGCVKISNMTKVNFKVIEKGLNVVVGKNRSF